jgi:hypothetical protein
MQDIEQKPWCLYLQYKFALQEEVRQKAASWVPQNPLIHKEELH